MHKRATGRGETLVLTQQRHGGDAAMPIGEAMTDLPCPI
jgi:hypothetical protein